MAEQLREAGADVMRQDTNMLFVRVGEEKCCRVRRIHESEKRAD
ncbi:hypothetical protein ACP0HM_00655 [Escherichia coli]